jgi:type VI secretion system VasD/TssJ family lipoprotein
MTGSPTMNNGGNAAVVKVYQLKGNATFKKVPVSAFWRDDEKALAGDLLGAPRKVTLYPSDSTSIEFQLIEKAQYIGVAANLRDPDREDWRSIHPVKGMGDHVSVTVEEQRVAVNVEKIGFFGKAMSLL